MRRREGVAVGTVVQKFDPEMIAHGVQFVVGKGRQNGARQSERVDAAVRIKIAARLGHVLDERIVEADVVSDDYAAVTEFIKIAGDFREHGGVRHHFVGYTREFDDDFGDLALRVDHSCEFFGYFAVDEPYRADFGYVVVRGGSPRRFEVDYDDVSTLEAFGDADIRVKKTGLANFFDGRRADDEITFGRAAGLPFLIDEILGQFAEIDRFYREPVVSGVGYFAVTEHYDLAPLLQFFEFFEIGFVVGEKRAGHSARSVVKVVNEERLARFRRFFADGYDLARDIEIARSFGGVLYVHDLVGFVVRKQARHRVHLEIARGDGFDAGVVDLFVGKHVGRVHVGARNVFYDEILAEIPFQIFAERSFEILCFKVRADVRFRAHVDEGDVLAYRDFQVGFGYSVPYGRASFVYESANPAGGDVGRAYRFTYRYADARERQFVLYHFGDFAFVVGGEMLA